jgi:aminopeptidase YwaD
VGRDYVDVVARGINRLRFYSFQLIIPMLLVITSLACSTGAAQQAAPTPLSNTVQATATSTAVPPTPSPEPVPEPTATATAAPTPTSTAEPVPTTVQTSGTSSKEAPKELAARISRAAMDFLTSFVENYRPSPSGTEKERIAAEFLASELKEAGYDTHLQPFTFELIPRDAPALTLLAPVQGNVWALPLSNSGVGKVVGPLVHVGKAFEGDIPAEGLDGKIALIERGDITFEEKVTRVAEAGALAAVIYNNISAQFGWTLEDQASIPAISITQEDGQALLERMEQGEVEVQVMVEVETRESQNVIAEKPGTSGGDGVVIIGGHYDTVPGVPGANDNTSGIASLMMIAREIADKEYPFTIRFIFFGSEELGLYGSRHYVDSLTPEEQGNIIAMLNYDALGAGEPSILGDVELTSKVMDYAKANSFDIQQSQGLRGGSSDHASFQAVGIPAVFFFGDDFSRIHTPSDAPEFIEPELMGIHVTLGLALLDMLAMPEQ